MTSQEPSAADPTPVPLPPVPAPTEADRRAVRLRLWWRDEERRRLRGDLLVALVVGAVIATATVVTQWRLDLAAANRAEALAAQAELAAKQRDDLRFVREVASGPAGGARPFSRLDLTGATLAGLQLGCEWPGDADCATFTNASLVGANVVGANLRGARFDASNSSEATFAWSDLRGASFIVSRVTAAIFTGADLRGATFEGAIVSVHSSVPSFGQADLRGATFETSSAEVEEGFASLDAVIVSEGSGWRFDDTCWDETTVWPEGFVPPPSNPEACRPE
ncbi:pentapeptide repeat-containing protein [Cellulosimicrobium cellulans]|uniref:pentapeptide repeat-containing protein n=1 Tax=Cellulosimicrobium cellulans TaxID=1710 RepID=UPI001BA4F51C|nr:pentapeptide repeat-containing protein [Cellulosimicrobium cellulans]QUC00623.1 pentapeptide repeat-containing protein [Cellulosimicrobium cellulans]